MSGGKIYAGDRFNLDQARRNFPERWAAFLDQYFESTVHVAFVFGVSYTTARNWKHCTVAPRAECVMLACKHVPDAFDFLMEAA